MQAAANAALGRWGAAPPGDIAAAAAPAAPSAVSLPGTAPCMDAIARGVHKRPHDTWVELRSAAESLRATDSPAALMRAPGARMAPGTAPLA